MKIVIILAFVFLIPIKGQSQDLLNKNKEFINTYTKKQNAILVFDKIITGIGDKPFRSLVYSFNKIQKEEKGIYQMTFDLQDDKCFRYFIAYKSNNYKAPLIKKFNAPNSGLKREKGESIWKNDIEKFEVRIADTRRGNVQAAMFMLVISKR